MTDQLREIQGSNFEAEELLHPQLSPDRHVIDLIFIPYDGRYRLDAIPYAPDRLPDFLIFTPFPDLCDGAAVPGWKDKDCSPGLHGRTAGIPVRAVPKSLILRAFREFL